MNLELNVVRFNNEDVIATSGETLIVALQPRTSQQQDNAHYHLSSTDYELEAGDPIVLGGTTYYVGNMCTHDYLTLRSSNDSQSNNNFVRSNVTEGTYVYADADASFKLVD